MTKEPTRLMREIAVVPGWAFALALLILLAVPTAILLAFRHESNAPALAFQIPFALFIGILPALFPLAIGYVNRDARRRGMNVTLWTLLAIFIPNGLGLLLYILLREPLRTPCPQCGQLALATFNFCPQCHHPLRPLCGSCGKPTQPEDRYCPFCGADLARAVA
jgi:hypothetical protein